MAIPLLAIGLAIAAAAGAAKSVVGAKQAKKGADMARSNTRPNFDIAKEYFTNQGLAESMAQSGLPQASLNFYQQQADRGLTSATDAMLRAGGGPNAIAGAYDQYNQGIQGIAAQDAMARVQNMRYLIDRNRDLAEQRSMQWSLNRYEPYKDRAQAAAQLQATGTQNIFSGISDIGSAFGSASKAGLYSNLGRANPAVRQTSYAGTPDQQVQQMNAYNDYRIGSALGNPNVTSQDASMMQRQQIIDDSLQGMDNSPYKDLIEQRLQRDYGIYNRATIG